MVTQNQECLMQSMTEQGIRCRRLSRLGTQNQRQSTTGASKLKTKLFSLELESTKTKGKEHKLQEKKKRGNYSED